MLPDTTGRFGLVQIFDWDGSRFTTPMSSSQIQSEAPHYDSVWGAFNPSAWDGAHPGMYVSRYMLPVEDDNLISGHDLAWWKANHPTWILYACDSNNNPTTHLAWSGTGFPDVPLDFHNPDVINYQINLVIPYLRANGYNTLAVDNTNLTNYLMAPNPPIEGQSAQSGWYGCGIYDANGNFVRRYNGPGVSSAFAADMLNWIATMKSALASNGMKLFSNHPLGSLSDPNEQALLSHIDGMVDENGFTHYGQYQLSSWGGVSGLFQSALAWMEYAQQHHVAFLVTDYYCRDGVQPTTGAACSNDPSTLTASQVDWALATYAIGNEGGADLFTSPHGGAVPSYRPEYAQRYGAPCGAYGTQGSVYVRRFQNGYAIANPTYTTQMVTLPSGHAYTDIEGRQVSNPLSVGPADGYMLITGGNGCS